MRLTVQQAAADLDRILAATEDGAVHIESEGKDVAVGLSPNRYAELARRSELERLMAASTERHRSVYRALAKWEAENEPPEA